MSTDEDLRNRAAKTLLGGRGRIEAKAFGLTPEQAARRQYGADAIDAVEAALVDDHVELTDELLAAVRDDNDLDDARAAANRDDDRDSDDDSGGNTANMMAVGDYVEQRKRKWDRLESNSTPTPSADPDDVVLAAMDGDGRVETNARGQSPAEYIQAEYGLIAAEYDDADALHADFMTEASGSTET